MRWILVAVVLQKVLAAPSWVAVVLVRKKEVRTADAIVGMGTVTVNNLAEQALPDHVEDRQVVTAKTPVLQHHARYARGLMCFHQLPTLIKRDGAWDFNGCILSRLHGVSRHGGVPHPRRGDHGCVEIATIHHALVVFLAACVEFGLRLPRLDNKLPCVFRRGGAGVAHHGHFNAIDRQQGR